MKPADNGAYLSTEETPEASINMDGIFLERSDDSILEKNMFYSHLSVAAVGIVILVILIEFLLPRLKHSTGMTPATLKILSMVLFVAITVRISSRSSEQWLRPIHSLSVEALKLSINKTDQTIPLSGEGEVRDLIIAFNSIQTRVKRISGSIQAQIMEIERKNSLFTRTKRVMANMMSELKEEQEKLIEQKITLEKTNLELDSFVYTASHDLRAPLRGINAFSKFLDLDYSDKLDDQGKNYLKKIRKGVVRMEQLIEDLLSLSRISRQKNPYEQVNIEELIQSVLERIEFDIEKNKVTLTIQPNMPTVFCDRIKMAEVFLNLINNGIKFSLKNNHEKPKLEIAYKDLGESHLFSVKDNGIGIDPRYHTKVFGLFQRLHKKSEYEGTGAGLNIVKRVIEDHKGKITIESELGKGASFCFTILKEITSPTTDLQEKQAISEFKTT